MNETISPALNLDGFNCPHCTAFAHQEKISLFYQVGVPTTGHRREKGLKLVRCSRCNLFSLWVNEKMVFPEVVAVDPPNPDLDLEIRQIYLEAAGVLGKSPRAAAALLRLCIQELLRQLRKPGKNLNSEIGELVAEGLPVEIQQALDIVRVVGNDAVHPGEIKIDDDQTTATQLFKWVNLIADDRISKPKAVQAAFDDLPDSKKEQIEQRDAADESGSCVPKSEPSE